MNDRADSYCERRHSTTRGRLAAPRQNRAEGGLVIAVAPCGRSAQPEVGPRGAWAGDIHKWWAVPFSTLIALAAHAAIRRTQRQGRLCGHPCSYPRRRNLRRQANKAAATACLAFRGPLDEHRHVCRCFVRASAASDGRQPARDAAAAAHTKARGRWAGEAPTSLEPSRRWHPRGVVPIELIY